MNFDTQHAGNADPTFKALPFGARYGVHLQNEPRPPHTSDRRACANRIAGFGIHDLRHPVNSPTDSLEKCDIRRAGLSRSGKLFDGDIRTAVDEHNGTFEEDHQRLGGLGHSDARAFIDFRFAGDDREIGSGPG